MSKHASFARLQRINPATAAELDRLFAYDLGGKGYVGYDAGQGEAYPLAPHPAFTRRRSWMAVPGSTTPLLDGFGNNVSGGAGSRAIATTSIRESMPRIAYTTAALSGSAGVRHGTAQFWRNTGDVGSGGGFVMACRFALVPTGAGYRWWIGMAQTVASIGTTQPSAILNAVGIGADSDDVYVNLMSNGASGVASEVSTGVAVTSIANVAIDVVIHSARFNSALGFAWRSVGGPWLSYAGVFAKAPASELMLAPQVHLNAGTILSGHAIEISSIYVETDI